MIMDMAALILHAPVSAGGSVWAWTRAWHHDAGIRPVSAQRLSVRVCSSVVPSATSRGCEDHLAFLSGDFRGAYANYLHTGYLTLPTLPQIEPVVTLHGVLHQHGLVSA